MPVLLANQNKVEMGQVLSFNAATQFIETQQSSSYYNESVQQYKETSEEFLEVDRAYATNREPFNWGNTLSRQTLGIQSSSDIFEDIALSDHFLSDYYTQVLLLLKYKLFLYTHTDHKTLLCPEHICMPGIFVFPPQQKAACVEPLNDVLLGYSFEGQDSPTGSLGSCSILESEDDLQFLNDLGPKFKTLAEACAPLKRPTPSASIQIEVAETPSPPLVAPAASLTSKVAAVVTAAADLVEPVVKSNREQSVVTKHTDVNAERVNISKMSVRAAPQPAVIPQSQITAISHSSNIVPAATLPRPAQTLVVQQQPVYYTTGAVLQPMQYVVQPHMQSTVLLADGARQDKIQGLYVVSGPQNPLSSGLVMTVPHGATSGLVVPSTQVPPPGVLISATQGPLSGLVVPSTQGLPSGLVFQGTESPQRPISTNSPISPVNPTVLVPMGQVVPQGSVSVEGWKTVGPHPAGNFTLVKDKSSPDGTQLVAPGSSQDILPRGANLVKGAAPPQGVLSPAAQRSVFGPLPRHTLAKDVGVFILEGSGWEGNTQVEGLETLVTGPLQVGMGHMVTANSEGRPAGILPVMIGPPGKAEVSMNQFQPIPQLKEVSDGVHVQKAEKKTRSPNKEKVPNAEKTTPMAKITNAPQPSQIKTFQEESSLVFKTHSDAIDEGYSERHKLFSFISEQHMTSNHQEPGDFGGGECEDKVRVQEPQTEERGKISDESPQVDAVESFPKSVLEASSEQFVPDQLIPSCKVSSEKFTDKFSQEEEFGDVKGNSDQGDFLSENNVDDLNVDTDVSSKEFIPGLGLTESIDGRREAEGVLTSLTTDQVSTVEDQVCMSSKKSVDTCKVKSFEDEAHKEDKLIHVDVGERFKNRQITDELVEFAGPGETVVVDLRDEGTTGPDGIQAEENVEEQSAVTTGAHNEAEEQRSDSEVEASPTPSETSATTMSDGESVPSPETTLELPLSEESEEVPAERETADKPKLEEDCREEDVLETEKVTVTSTQVQAEEDIENMATIDDSVDEEFEKQCDVGEETSETYAEISNKAEEMFANALEIISEPPVDRNERGKMDNTSGSEAAAPEHTDVAEKEEELNLSEISEEGRRELDQPITLVESEVESDQVGSDSGDVSDGEKEEIVVEKVSQLTFKSDEDTDPKRSLQPENNLIPDQNFNFEAEGEAAVEGTVSSEWKDLFFLVDKERSTEAKPEETLVLSYQEGVKVASPLQANVNTADIQVEEFETEGGKAPSPPMKDQVLLEGTTADGEEEEEVEAEAIYDSFSSDDKATQEGVASEGYSEDSVGDKIRDDVSEEADQQPIDSPTISISDEVSKDHDRPDEGLGEDNKLNPDNNVSHGTNDDVEEEPPPFQCTTNMLENDEVNAAASSKEQLFPSDDDVNNLDGEVYYTLGDQSEVGQEEETGERTSLHSVNHLDYSDSVNDQDERALSSSPFQQNVSIPDIEDDASVENEELVLSTESCTVLENPLSFGMAASEVTVTEEKHCEEVASDGEIILDAGGQESMVATGQVLSPRADQGGTSSKTDHGDVDQPGSENTDTLRAELKDEEGLILVKSEKEGLYEFREGILIAPAEAVSSLETVEDNILPQMLETDPVSSEAEEGSFTPTHEEAADLVQEGSNKRGEPEGFQTCFLDVELKASPGAQEPEEGNGGGEGGGGREQESSGTQVLVKESKRTKAESRKALQGSGKCKQQ